MMWLMLLLSLSSPKQIDNAGRRAFSALRDLQRVELTHVRAHDQWPSPEQDKQLAAHMIVANETVWDSLKLGADLSADGPRAQVVSLLRSQRSSVAELVRLTADGPADAQKAGKRVQAAFDRLLGLFPTVAGEAYEHPPQRRP